uniref:Major facilitator superfamily (MFS) profile domain-containing protein n=1 Tax=Chromera velia CCMP2878 TaxID=1169474 RepID=A0A0G4IFI8_9ALVE|mmetsp:Transcript_8575/g.16853  ORF Transcript_8575/g.16853 Transcript_8575/m.16853 type:complete len:691 (-) Transcript_8575:295-2367(-)|eukprot:Cvel_2448.t1-p1 / transcript=Cvel_2448.t1 / gene=Cvel_2448 / organism=Chromera_velia_CCMP2878 / gene_product=hypothetical protein / transcript_product=hypothetical protein / location=Cvel_scaffold96:20926-22995(-) / protein_length=690 / sequence_SO=supercontig / SO=protein_coding / is_pseudo=false
MEKERMRLGAFMSPALVELLGCPRELFLVFALKFLESYAYFVFSYTLILFLSDEYELTDEEAGWTYGLYGMLTSAYGLVIGALIDRLGVKRSLIFGCSILFLSRLVLTFVTDIRVVSFILFSTLPVGSAMGIPVMQIGIRRFAPPGCQTLAYSLFYVMMNAAAISAAPAIDAFHQFFPSGLDIPLPFPDLFWKLLGYATGVKDPMHRVTGPPRTIHLSSFRLLIGSGALMTLGALLTSVFLVRDVELVEVPASVWEEGEGGTVTGAESSRKRPSPACSDSSVSSKGSRPSPVTSHSHAALSLAALRTSSFECEGETEGDDTCPEVTTMDESVPLLRSTRKGSKSANGSGREGRQGETVRSDSLLPSTSLPSSRQATEEREEKIVRESLSTRENLSFATEKKTDLEGGKLKKRYVLRPRADLSSSKDTLFGLPSFLTGSSPPSSSDKETAKTDQRSSLFGAHRSVLLSASFWRFFLLTVLLLGVRVVFRHLDATFPKYMVRMFGKDVMYGSILALNPLIVVSAVPVLAFTMSHVSPLTMINFGSAISAIAPLALAGGHSIERSILFVVLLSIGEAIWSPRFYEYAVSVAEKGREGTYIALSSAPLFLATLLTGGMSGWMIETFCPEHGGRRRPEMMWLLISAMSILSPILMLFCRGVIEGRAKETAQTNGEFKKETDTDTHAFPAADAAIA